MSTPPMVSMLLLSPAMLASAGSLLMIIFPRLVRLFKPKLVCKKLYSSSRVSPTNVSAVKYESEVIEVWDIFSF